MLECARSTAVRFALLASHRQADCRLQAVGRLVHGCPRQRAIDGVTILIGVLRLQRRQIQRANHLLLAGLGVRREAESRLLRIGRLIGRRQCKPSLHGLNGW